MLKKLRAPTRRTGRDPDRDEAHRPGAALVDALVEEEVRRRTRELQAAFEERTRRLRELDHLNKNNLQTLSSIVLLKARRTEDEAARRGLLNMAERITALSTMYRLLDPASLSGRFDVAAFLDDLAGELATSVDPRRIALKLDLDPLDVPERDAAPMALLLNELVTNALRHAFPEGRKGRVSISTRRTEGGGRIVVEDDGIGLETAAPSSEAFGRTLSEMLARQLKAELLWEDAAPGTRAVLVLGRTA
ncbi:MAG TPA: sensor histidine kinase [Beijerinckiaceae bacterium]|jgi:two-component sensor histidine kinase